MSKTSEAVVTESPILGLAVDDTRASREIMAQTLTLAGCDSITSLDGHAGWLLVEALVPSIVITDLDMPGWNGIELIEAMRRSTNPSVREIPVIVCSSTRSATAIRAAFNAGGDRFLSKPIPISVLCKAIYLLLNEHASHNDFSDDPSQAHSNAEDYTD